MASKLKTHQCISTNEDTFNQLPTELILHIFSYLDLHDRIGLERVCKRWKGINETNQWFIITGELNVLDILYDDSVVLRLLEKHGRRLRRISACFETCFKEYPCSFVVKNIFTHCPNLIAVDFSAINEKSANKLLLRLPKLCNRLQKVRLSGTECLDKLVVSLLKNCPIRELELSCLVELTGDSLNDLNSTMRKLTLNYWHCCDVISIAPGPNWQHLTHLKISSCLSLSTESIVRILKRVGGSLLHLHLREPNPEDKDKYPDDYVQIDWEMICDGLSTCGNLQSLKLDGDDIAIDNISNLVSLNCVHLKTMKLKLNELTRLSCAALASCPSLEVLKVQVPRRLGMDEGVLEEGALVELVKSVSIKSIIFTCVCKGISKEDVIVLLSTCENLRSLYIDYVIEFPSSMQSVVEQLGFKYELDGNIFEASKTI